MAFKSFERSTLVLSMTVLSTLGVAKTHAQISEVPAAPATAEACVALASNADRLACYDALFKIPEAVKPRIVSEQRAAMEIAPEPENITGKIAQSVSSVFASEGPKISPNLFLMDSRWELSPESKLGTWNIRAYQPVYLMPGFWTTDKNEYHKVQIRPIRWMKIRT